MTEQPHILVVTPKADDPDAFDYEIECPDVTNACRAYEDCGANLDEQAALEGALDGTGSKPVAHDKRHLFIDSTWMAETEQCRVATFDRLDEAAGYTNLPAGRRPVDFDFGDGTELILLPLIEAVA